MQIKFFFFSLSKSLFQNKFMQPKRVKGLAWNIMLYIGHSST